MPRFWYHNECMTGVLDVSDYHFSCVIDADTAEQAMAWGHRVAEEYNGRYGLLPRGNRLDLDWIPKNASLSPWESDDDQYFDRHLACKFDQMPDFEGWFLQSNPD